MPQSMHHDSRHEEKELAPDVPTCHLFVYGTLRSNQPNAPRLGGATPLGWATTHGQLLDLGDYPGLVDGPSRVVGELFLIPTAALGRIDELEGFDPAEPEGSLFLREIREVDVPGKGAFQAQTYRWPHGGGTVIESGDWVRHLQERDAPKPLWLS